MDLKIRLELLMRLYKVKECEAEIEKDTRQSFELLKNLLLKVRFLQFSFSLKRETSLKEK